MKQVYKTVFKYFEILKRKGGRREKRNKQEKKQKQKENNQGVNGTDVLIIH